MNLLHTFYLGPPLSWCRTVIWSVLTSSIWGLHEHSAPEKLVSALSSLKAELKLFYKQSRKEKKGLTEITEITVKMLGSRKKPALKVKAKECSGLAHFLVFLLGKYSAHLSKDGPKLAEMGALLLDTLALLKSSEATVPRPTQQKLLDNWKRFMRFSEDLSISTPKTHLMIHLLLRIEGMGNPYLYHTFRDEGLNRLLKSVLRNSPQSTFEFTGLAKMSVLLQEGTKRRRDD